MERCKTANTDSDSDSSASNHRLLVRSVCAPSAQLATLCDPTCVQIFTKILTENSHAKLSFMYIYVCMYTYVDMYECARVCLCVFSHKLCRCAYDTFFHGLEQNQCYCGPAVGWTHLFRVWSKHCDLWDQIKFVNFSFKVWKRSICIEHWGTQVFQFIEIHSFFHSYSKSYHNTAV